MRSDGFRVVSRRRLLRGVAFVAVVLIAFGSAADAVLAHRGAPHARSAAASPARTLSIVCAAPSLGGTMPALGYLPSGYSSRRRYPVIYFLHGLPAGPASYQ